MLTTALENSEQDNRKLQDQSQNIADIETLQLDWEETLRKRIEGEIRDLVAKFMVEIAQLQGLLQESKVQIAQYEEHIDFQDNEINNIQLYYQKQLGIQGV